MEENRENLIETANTISSETERVEYVLSYLLRTIEYNYAYLFGAYMQGDINGATLNSLTKRNDGEKETWLFDCRFIGEGPILQEVLDAYNPNDLSKVKSIVIKELTKHIDNLEIVEKEAERFIEALKRQAHTKRSLTSQVIQDNLMNPTFDMEEVFKYCQEENTLELPRTIANVLSDFIGDGKLHETFPPIIENGILRRGVCRDYADYLAELLKDIGIEAYRIDGKSELDHAWVAAKIDGQWKSIDLTRAVFIRDGFKGIPSDQKSEDWLISDFEKTFEMQPTRCIERIVVDGEKKELPEVINSNNFNLELLEEYIKQLTSSMDIN